MLPVQGPEGMVIAGFDFLGVLAVFFGGSSSSSSSLSASAFFDFFAGVFGWAFFLVLVGDATSSSSLSCGVAALVLFRVLLRTGGDGLSEGGFQLPSWSLELDFFGLLLQLLVTIRLGLFLTSELESWAGLFLSTWSG
jgi:hypothetical protein